MKTLLFLFLSLLFVLETRLILLGSPVNIGTNDRGLQGAVLTAAYSFNNQSNDAFLFKPSAIRRAQRQVVNGYRYFVDLDISRTVCQKGNLNDFSECNFQAKGPLQQTFHCHYDIWVIPRENKTQIMDFIC